MITTQLQIQFIYHFQQEISKINILSQGYETHSISVFSATITSYDMLQMFTYTLLKNKPLETRVRKFRITALHVSLDIWRIPRLILFFSFFISSRLSV